MSKASWQLRCAAIVAAVASCWSGALPLDRSAGEARAAEAPFYRLPLGARTLRLGDRGADVKTLNWALRSEALDAPYSGAFIDQTDAAVRSRQRSAGLQEDGVVGRPTMKAIAAGMPRNRASWYGPGLWGRRTACGVRLTKKTVGVAHRSLPCGTRVTLAYRGHWTRARVIDRGPYRKGYGLDLTRKLAAKLGVVAVGRAKVKIGVVP
ncbi:MAG: RlpA-like double-psi beta-barrel domain-containing protein [Solirubrobacterales bacterium]